MYNNTSQVGPSANTTFAFDGGCDEIPAVKWSIRLIYSLMLVIGLVGNAVVCAAIIRKKRMRSSINLFTFNLAFSDLIIVIIYVPSQMVAQENCQLWVLGKVMCHVVYVILPLCTSTSIGSLLTISCDRYRAIIYPMKPKLSMNMVKIIIALIWIVSALTALPLMLVVQTYTVVPGVVVCFEYWPKAVWGTAYWIVIFFMQYVIPLTMIATQAVIVCIRLRKTKIPLIGASSENVYKSTLRRRIRQTKKVTNMLIALILLYAICLLPQHAVYTFWSTFGDFSALDDRTRVILFEVVNAFPIANSALNAIAYGTLNKEFKNVFKAVFQVSLCGSKRNDFQALRRNLTSNHTSKTNASRV